MTSSRTALEKILDEHEVRLTVLGDRVAGVEHKADLIITALSDLKTAFAAAQARGNLTLGGSLDAILKAGLIIGLTVSAIIYVTSSSTAKEYAVLQYRLEQLEKSHVLTWRQRDDKP